LVSPGLFNIISKRLRVKFKISNSHYLAVQGEMETMVIWKEVKNFPGRMLAEQAKEILEREGIVAVIQGDDVGIFGPGVASTVRGVSLYVPEKDCERARELIEALYDGI